ncbi:hypothetical protein WJX72_005569 [[Myrmecia] bisecta]|uniref:3-hydroxyacyl-CoA dehydrogenase n=1 Tax=[Myrmecia] bisecta TaxID=41462 RepID=A0AAW1PXK2_9CHLO
MSGPTAALQLHDHGVAVITLQNPPVNALHPKLLESLFTCLAEAQASREVKAIVITGDGGLFSAGFDIAVFTQQSGGGIDRTVNDKLCTLVEDGPKPTVAAIEGIALGGGCEVALACNARVCTPGTKLGLPELQLGILPGFGGTQRLPRLVGLQKACEMMLTSQPVTAQAAAQLGLVDAVVPHDELLSVAKQVALDIADGRTARLMTLYRTDKLPPLPEALMIINFAKAQSTKRAPQLRHPQLCLDAVHTGVAFGGQAGLVKEQEAFAEAASLDTHKALVHIFFAQRATKRVKGVTDCGLAARPVKSLAVIGGGLMGSGIATASVLVGIQVLMKEVNAQFLQAGLDRIKANLRNRVKKGKMSQDAADAALARVSGTLEYTQFSEVDMVIEAVIEDVSLKQRIFTDLEKVCRPDAILATNTSTIDIDVVGAKTRAADRIIGAHFFSPAHVMPLLEIVRTSKTSKQVVLDTLEYGSQIRKTPVVVGNCTGFAVNRVFFPYTQGACLLVDMGLDPYVIDKVIAQQFGMPMGPFRLSDLVGADIGMHVGKSYLEAFPDRVYVSKLIMGLNAANRLGEKTGQGFYKFDSNRRAVQDPALQPIVDASRRAARISIPGLEASSMTVRDIVEFIFFPVVNEGCRVIEEGIVDKPADLDVASVLAMGFPAFRGGIIKWADLLSAAYVHKRLQRWADDFAPVGLAGVFKPSRYLEKACAAGVQLGAGVNVSSQL